MATEADLIMRQFDADLAREKIKDEERRLKKGALGYVGGLTGFIEDTTAGVLGYQIGSNIGTTIENIRDPRSFQAMTDDYIKEYRSQIMANFEGLIQDIKGIYDQGLKLRSEDPSTLEDFNAVNDIINS